MGPPAGVGCARLEHPYSAERRAEPVPEGLEEEDYQEEALESEDLSEDEYSLVTDEGHEPGFTPDNEEEDI